MEKNKQIIEKGELPITVSREIVPHLSIGLYRNFARAIKELISNSYDAGSTEVKIKLDLEEKPSKIIVRDNGLGMNKKDIEEKFLNIGTPTPLTEDIDELGRKRIGTFGIGCLSVFPYAKTVKVISKKKNENDIIEVTIDADRFFTGGTFLIKKAKVPYRKYKGDLPKDKGETIIILEDIRPHIKEELAHKDSSHKSSLDKFGGFQKFKWSLSQYIPIQFPPARKDLKDFFEVPNRSPLRVWVNGEELFRNVPEKAKILESNEKDFNGIHLKYAIMSPMEPIRPGEAKGLQIRLRDVAIGLPTDFNIISLTGKVPGKLNWICGEIHIFEGLKSALMIDRDSFSFTKEVAEVHDFFRKRLVFWNNTLEEWASEDKDIYRSISKFEDSDNIKAEFKKSGILRIPEERLRIKKAALVKPLIRDMLSPTEELRKTLSRRGYKVIPQKGKLPKGKPAVEVISEEKSILIREDHPELREKLIIGKKTYKVTYDTWDHKKTPYSVCKLSEDKKSAVFNSSHPLFKSKLDDEVIKKLSLGILLITLGREDQQNLLKSLYALIEEIFLG